MIHSSYVSRFVDQLIASNVDKDVFSADVFDALMIEPVVYEMQARGYSAEQDQSALLRLVFTHIGRGQRHEEESPTEAQKLQHAYSRSVSGTFGLVGPACRP
jgi:hypothetical protein